MTGSDHAPSGMIQLLVLGDARMAQALVDYLATLGIPCELTQSELGVSVWLADERRLAQAQQEVKRFLAEPNHPRYMEASWQSGRADARIDYSKGMTDPVTDFLHQAGPLTLVVIIACLAIYALDAIGLPIFDELAFHPTLAQHSSLHPSAPPRYTIPKLSLFPVHLVLTPSHPTLPFLKLLFAHCTTSRFAPKLSRYPFFRLPLLRNAPCPTLLFLPQTSPCPMY